MSKQNIALITGVTGQDGSYLAELLLEKGYEVFGGSRDASTNTFENLRKLNLKDKISLVSINICDFRSTLQTKLSRFRTWQWIWGSE